MLECRRAVASMIDKMESGEMKPESSRSNSLNMLKWPSTSCGAAWRVAGRHKPRDGRTQKAEARHGTAQHLLRVVAELSGVEIHATATSRGSVARGLWAGGWHVSGSECLIASVFVRSRAILC